MKAPKVSTAVQTAFNRLMQAYPPRGDNPRAPALIVFARLVDEGEDPEALVRAAGRFAEVIRAEKRERRMIPHTRRWLNQRYFDDYMDALASAGDDQPNPEHPLAFMATEIGLAAWRSYLEPLDIDASATPIAITARTSFALAHIRKSWWDRQIEDRLGAIDWRVKS